MSTLPQSAFRLPGARCGRSSRCSTPRVFGLSCRRRRRGRGDLQAELSGAHELRQPAPVPRQPDSAASRDRLSFAGTIAHDATRTWRAWPWSRSWPSWRLGRRLADRRPGAAAAADDNCLGPGISATQLHQRLRPHGAGDEFGELGDTLDSLFGRLEAVVPGAAALRGQRVPRAAHPARGGEDRAPGRTRRPGASRGDPATTCESRCSGTTSRNGSSTRCSLWPAASARSSAGSPSISPMSPGRSSWAAVGGGAPRHPDRRGAQVGARPRRPGPGREPDREPGRQRDSAQPGRRPGRDLHRDHRRAGRHYCQQHRAGGRRRRGGPAVPAVPAARQPAAGFQRVSQATGTDSAWPSSAPSPGSTARRWPLTRPDGGLDVQVGFPRDPYGPPSAG